MKIALFPSRRTMLLHTWIVCLDGDNKFIDPHVHNVSVWQNHSGALVSRYRISDHDHQQQLLSRITMGKSLSYVKIGRYALHPTNTDKSTPVWFQRYRL